MRTATGTKGAQGHLSESSRHILPGRFLAGPLALRTIQVGMVLASLSSRYRRDTSTLDAERFRIGGGTMHPAIALFGEAERGQYRRGLYCNSLAQLVDNFGNPPPDSKGLHLAVQSLMYERDIIFYRVREEGFSVQDYFKGLQNLQLALGQVSLVAIALPGVGDEEVIDYSMHICHQIKSVLITTEADLYDYLTVFDRRGKD